MNHGDGIVGTCQYMCPISEILERERAMLIHFFEQADNQPIRYEDDKTSAFRGRGARGRSSSNFNQRQRRIREVIKADQAKAIKAYTRPAAGVNKTIPSDLRPSPVLKKTVAYLCTKILLRTDRPFIDVYDFIFDRLRAVRQDMVIQRINDISAIQILEAIIKFHIYAEYKFRYNAPSSYDPVINQKHLRDCLKTLLSLYGQNNYRGSTRPFFEALYCLSSPESYEVISRAFEIRNEMRDSEVFMDALDMCLSIQNRNFYKYFQLLDELPPLLAAFAVQQVPSMRIHALKAMSLSYGVQSCKVPLEWVEELLCYPSSLRAEKDVIRIGCQIVKNEETGDKFVKFSKTAPFIKNGEITIDFEVKFTVLSGLNNAEVIAIEQICPWARELL